MVRYSEAVVSVTDHHLSCAHSVEIGGVQCTVVWSFGAVKSYFEV